MDILTFLYLIIEINLTFLRIIISKFVVPTFIIEKLHFLRKFMQTKQQFILLSYVIEVKCCKCV